jgi:hypothetical protein
VSFPDLITYCQPLVVLAAVSLLLRSYWDCTSLPERVGWPRDGRTKRLGLPVLRRPYSGPPLVAHVPHTYANRYGPHFVEQGDDFVTVIGPLTNAITKSTPKLRGGSNQNRRRVRKGVTLNSLSDLWPEEYWTSGSESDENDQPGESSKQHRPVRNYSVDRKRYHFSDSSDEERNDPAPSIPRTSGHAPRDTFESDRAANMANNWPYDQLEGQDDEAITSSQWYREQKRQGKMPIHEEPEVSESQEPQTTFPQTQAELADPLGPVPLAGDPEIQFPHLDNEILRGSLPTAMPPSEQHIQGAHSQYDIWPFGPQEPSPRADVLPCTAKTDGKYAYSQKTGLARPEPAEVGDNTQAPKLPPRTKTGKYAYSKGTGLARPDPDDADFNTQTSGSLTPPKRTHKTSHAGPTRHRNHDKDDDDDSDQDHLLKLRKHHKSTRRDHSLSPLPNRRHDRDHDRDRSLSRLPDRRLDRDRNRDRDRDRERVRSLSPLPLHLPIPIRRIPLAGRPRRQIYLFAAPTELVDPNDYYEGRRLYTYERVPRPRQRGQRHRQRHGRRPRPQAVYIQNFVTPNPAPFAQPYGAGNQLQLQEQQYQQYQQPQQVRQVRQVRYVDPRQYADAVPLHHHQEEGYGGGYGQAAAAAAAAAAADRGHYYQGYGHGGQDPQDPQQGQWLRVPVHDGYGGYRAEEEWYYPDEEEIEQEYQVRYGRGGRF